jgi:hypothetical protein
MNNRSKNTLRPQKILLFSRFHERSPVYLILPEELGLFYRFFDEVEANNEYANPHRNSPVWKWPVSTF